MSFRKEIDLSAAEVSTLVHALRVAAARFEEDVETVLDSNVGRLAEQFKRQAKESRELADKIEDAGAVRVLAEVA